jgi:SpoVK/Ycf46/Vps4 family AAA+-type ATPase
MSVPARTAIRGVSRTRTYLHPPTRLLQNRTFHSSSLPQDEAKPPEDPRDLDKRSNLRSLGLGEVATHVDKTIGKSLHSQLKSDLLSKLNQLARLEHDRFLSTNHGERKINVSTKERGEDAETEGLRGEEVEAADKASVSTLIQRWRATTSRFRKLLKSCPVKSNRIELTDNLELVHESMERFAEDILKSPWDPKALRVARLQMAEIHDRMGRDYLRLKEILDPTADESGHKERNITKDANNSSRRRLRKRQKNLEAPPVLLPDWFYERNITLYQGVNFDNGSVPQNRNVSSKEDLIEWTRSMSNPNYAEKNRLAGPFNAASAHIANFSGQTEFYLDFEPYMEISAAIAASFALSQGRTSAPEAKKANLVLYCTFEGGTQFLKSVVNSVADGLEADVLRLDMHDLAALSGHYLIDEASVEVQQLGSISLDSSQEVTKVVDRQKERKEPKDEEEDEESGSLGSDTVIGLDQLKDYLLQVDTVRPERSSFGRPNDGEGKSGTVVSLTRFLDRLIKAVYVRRNKTTRNESSSNYIATPSSQTGKQSDGTVSPSHSTDTRLISPIGHLPAVKPRLIICLEDFRGLSATPIGAKVLQTLGNLVDLKREKYGDLITIVGTTSSSQLSPNSEIQKPYNERYQTMLVNPLEGDLVNLSARKPKARHITGIPAALTIWDCAVGNETQITNLRNIQEVIRRLLPAATPAVCFEDPATVPDSLLHFPGLKSHVLKADEVHRIATTAIGLHEISAGEVNFKDIQHAMLLCRESDASRASSSAESHKGSKPKISEGGNIHQRMQRLKPNKYEKELLAGVIYPDKIRTGFSDVHAAADTIESLRTMTSLSMTRPDAFSYGILKSDSLSGLLMYGPPGTGKTMLARAVAKESGATVLNITASDVRHMWVGEAEKITRAIFSLSQKLSPCIVFIDEADSLLGARSQKDHSRNHRDTINQFLLEWDGLTERDVFLMIATNRPFDLDDAVLRRLPRRLLVDLPKKEDREAILGIHLKEEALDESVSLADLAERTPFYSGSDLKNVVVSAALACVKEETEVAAKAKADGITDYQYPARRTLKNLHFDKALQEVAASVSGDMPSLKAIRKFDQQYGERKGKKPKTSMGFVQEPAKEGSARVRA